MRHIFGAYVYRFSQHLMLNKTSVLTIKFGHWSILWSSFCTVCEQVNGMVFRWCLKYRPLCHSGRYFKTSLIMWDNLVCVSERGLFRQLLGVWVETSGRTAPELIRMNFLSLYFPSSTTGVPEERHTGETHPGDSHPALALPGKYFVNVLLGCSSRKHPEGNDELYTFC